MNAARVQIMDAYGNLYDDPLPSLYRLFVVPVDATGTVAAARKQRIVYATISNFDEAEGAYRWAFHCARVGSSCNASCDEQ
jgi:hypothetical protein